MFTTQSGSESSALPSFDYGHDDRLFSSDLLLGLAILPFTTAQENVTTIILPPSYSSHNTSNLLCRPTKWSDVVVFFLGNYVAHAATVKTSPGESPLGVIIIVCSALLFPPSGVVRGFNASSSLAVFAPTELRRAARAGALCTVEYNVKKPLTKLETFTTIDPRSTRIHGFVSNLPRHYRLVRVPRSAKFLNDPDPEPRSWYQMPSDSIRRLFIPSPTRSTVISSNYSLVKIFAAIAQTTFGIATLYNAKGDQIDRYGYAAYGLTVVPYAYMSLVNLLANLLAPEYPTMYLVKSQAMRDAADEIRDARSEVQANIETSGTSLEPLGDGIGSLEGESGATKKPDEEFTEKLLHSEEQDGSPDEHIERPARSSGGHTPPQNPSHSPSRQTPGPDPRRLAEESPDIDEESQNRPSHGESPSSRPFSGTVGTLDPEWATENLAQTPKSNSPSDVVDTHLEHGAQRGRADDVDPLAQRDYYGRSENTQGSGVESGEPILPGAEDNTRLPGVRSPSRHARPLYVRILRFIGSVVVFLLCILLGIVSCAGVLSILALPLAVVGGLSSFREGAMSTHAQRVWTMTWLAFGIFIGPTVELFRASNMVALSTPGQYYNVTNRRSPYGKAFLASMLIFYGAPAVGGFVVVAQMLMAYGVCFKIT